MTDFVNSCHVCFKAGINQFVVTTRKHRTLSSKLAEDIRTGKYRPGARLPSEAQLVKQFGISRPTVGRALRDLQEQGMIERRAGSGTYVQAERAIALPTASPLTQIGLIVPSLRHTEIFESICGEIASLARVHEYGLWWGGSALPPTGEIDLRIEETESLCAQFIERGVAGVFFVPFEHRPDCERASQRITTSLQQAGIPVILLDRDISSVLHRSTLDLVGVDNFAGGYALATHLIKLGSCRLGYFTRPNTAPTVHARIAGAHAAMRDHGIVVFPDFVRAGEPGDEKLVRTFVLSNRLDAILCTSDHVAAQLLQTLSRLRIRVPEDIRLVGFDDMRIASLLTVPLTTMAQPTRDIAATAFQAMCERLAGLALPTRTLLLTPRLVVRESCGAYLRKK